MKRRFTNNASGIAASVGVIGVLTGTHGSSANYRAARTPVKMISTIPNARTHRGRRSVLGGAVMKFLSAMLPGVMLGSFEVSYGEVTPFASPLPGNAAAFSVWAASNGLTVDRSVDFSTHPVGPVIPSWYAASHGVTITTMGPHGDVIVGPGSQTGSGGSTTVGEGYMPEPESFIDTAFGTVVTVQFQQPVLGAGFMTADLYGPEQVIELELLDAGGLPYSVVLGSATNFQLDILYFIGAADLGGFSGMRLRLPSPRGDSVYIPEIWIAREVCVADVDDGSGTGTPDGGVTIDDLIYYLALFEAGAVAADVDDGSGSGTPDGGVTIDDLIYYLTRFEAGC